MPDLNKLNWDELKAELEQELRHRGLITLSDISRLEQRGRLSGAILKVFRPAILTLYKEERGYDK